MKELYKIIEKMTLEGNFDIMKLVNCLNGRLDVRTTSGFQIFDKRLKIVAEIVNRYGTLSVRIPPHRDQLLISDGIILLDQEHENLYDFLVRNKLLTPDHIPELQRLILEQL